MGTLAMHPIEKERGIRSNFQERQVLQKVQGISALSEPVGGENVSYYGSTSKATSPKSFGRPTWCFAIR